MRNLSKVVGINFTIRGGENLRGDKSCVLVSNHQSSLDILGNLIDDV